MRDKYKPSVVYALVDPRNQAIRYIGATQNLHRRLLEHVNPREVATSGVKVRSWVADLAAEDLVPGVVMLEEVDGEHRQERESQWIYFGRSVGWDLLNIIGGFPRNE